MSRISPAAQVDTNAQVADDVEIGPFCYVGANVVLGVGCKLHNNVTITGHTTVGENNMFFPNCVMGADPQDLKYGGKPTKLMIGNGNVFREFVTAHPGTEVGGGITAIGNDNRILIGVHIAHDCRIGNACVFANNVQFGGHCAVEDYVGIGGLAGVHHFVTLGKHAFVAGATRVTMDIPPFVLAAGFETRVRALNTEGLKRCDFTETQLANLRAAYRVLFSKRAGRGPDSLDEKVAVLKEGKHYDENVEYLCRFVRRSTEEGVFGRYLESRRKDSPEARKQFYERVLAGQDHHPKTEQED